MTKTKWIILAIIGLVAVLFIQDRMAYSSARSKALDGCISDFQARFNGSAEDHQAECESLFEADGH